MADQSPGPSPAQWVAILAPLVVGLLLYPVTFSFAQYVVAGLPPDAAARELLRDDFSFWTAGLAAIPFNLLSAVLLVQSWRGPTRTTLGLALGGLVSLCWRLIPGYFSMEAAFYGPDRPSSTAALGYLFAPFVALPYLLAGLVAGWAVSRLPWWASSGRGAAALPVAIALASLALAGVGIAATRDWARETRIAYERYRVATSPEATADELREVAGVDDPRLRAYLAENSNTPQDLLERLGMEGGLYVQRTVARNPSYVGATLELSGVELEWQPNVWTAVQTGENSYFLLRRYETPLREVVLESYPFSSVRSGTGDDELDLAAIAADLSIDVDEGTGPRFTDPSHRTMALGDREWGWTTFSGPRGQVLHYVYAPACERVVALRFRHSEEAVSQAGYRGEFFAATLFLRLMRRTCEDGDPVGIPVRPSAADRRRLVVESPLISKRSGLPEDGRRRDAAPILLEGNAGTPPATIQWNGRSVHAIGEEGTMAILGSGEDRLASSDLTGFDSIALIQATPFCLGGDGRRGLAVYAQVGDIGGRGVFVIYAPDGTTVHQEFLEPDLGSGIRLDREAESRELSLHHGGDWTYGCRIEGGWSDG